MARKAITVEVDLRALKKMPAAARRAVGQEVSLAALDLLSEAVRLAPVKEGTLRGSGSVHFGGKRIATGSDFDALAIPGEAASGGEGTGPMTAAVIFNTVYATAQHERMDFNHPKGGQAKYLETPLERNRKQYERRIAEAVKKVT